MFSRFFVNHRGLERLVFVHDIIYSKYNSVSAKLEGGTEQNEICKKHKTKYSKNIKQNTQKT